jgi:hypothetical protein
MSDDPKDVVVEFAKVCSEAITSYKLYWHLFEMDEQRLTLYDLSLQNSQTRPNH